MKLPAAVLFALIVVLGACSGSDSAVDIADEPTAVEAEAVEPDPTAVPEPTAEPEPEPTEAPEPEPAEETEPVETDEVDETESTDAGSGTAPAMSDTEVEQMLSFMGIDGPDGTACVTDFLADEGLTVVDAMEGAGVLIAALNCDADPEAIFGSATDVDTTGTDLTDDDLQCAFDEMIGYIKAVPLSEADGFFDTPEPPAELTDGMVASCDITQEEAAILMG